MNALFGTVIKFFLALVQTNHAVGQDDGDGSDRRDGQGTIGQAGSHGSKNQKVTLILTADRSKILSSATANAFLDVPSA